MDASIVQWELETATTHEEMELMGFKKDGLPPESVEPQQAEFLDKLGGFVDGNWLGTFKAPGTLVEKVLSALLDWQTELNQKIEEMEGRRRGWRDKLLVPTASASVLGLFALTQKKIFPLIDGASLGVGALIAICVTGATVALWRKGK